MSKALLVVAATIVIVGIVVILVRGRRPPVPIVERPRWGIANFLGDSGQHYVDEDIASLAMTLGPPTRRDADVPRCEVLFLYAHLLSNGSVENSTRGLRELIRDSGALVVVVASENTPDAYIAAAAPKAYGSANLVMTLARKGKGFGEFFTGLFTRMRAGVSMPVAWVQLAPQLEALQNPAFPESIFACELGQLAFGPSD